jgi:hypothetical protein
MQQTLKLNNEKKSLFYKEKRLVGLTPHSFIKQRLTSLHPDSDVDLVQLLKFRDAPSGIKQVPGICQNREGGLADVAYQVRHHFY